MYTIIELNQNGLIPENDQNYLSETFLPSLTFGTLNHAWLTNDFDEAVAMLNQVEKSFDSMIINLEGI